jgi:hypothetical protein
MTSKVQMALQHITLEGDGTGISVNEPSILWNDFSGCGFLCSGAAQFASLHCDSVNLDGGAIDGTVIGASSVAAGFFCCPSWYNRNFQWCALKVMTQQKPLQQPMVLYKLTVV